MVLVNQDNHHLLHRAFLGVQERTPTFTLKETLRVLLNQAGLVADLDSSKTSLLPHFLCSTFLNHDPSPSAVLSLEESQISIPPRSKLAGLALSHSLRITIFLFSGLSKPLVFSPSPLSSIGLFHAIDSTGRASSSHPLVRGMSEPRDNNRTPTPPPPSESNDHPLAQWRPHPDPERGKSTPSWTETNALRNFNYYLKRI